MGENVRHPRHDLELLQHLRPPAARGEIYPTADYESFDWRSRQLYGNGLNIRDWIHVDDHSRAVWTILTRGRIGETYLIGADGERSNYDVLQTILKAMGRPADDFDWVKDRPGHDRRYAIDAGKLRRELGWQPLHTDFEAGLRDVVEWYRTHEAWWRDAKAGAEAKYREAGLV